MMSAKVFNIREFGAAGNGTQKDTAAIQKSLDDCSANGGGVVHFPPGQYICATLFLKNNLILDFSVGAVLKYSPDEDDFAEPEELPSTPQADIETCFFRFSLLFGENIRNLTIRGPGTIDGGPYLRPGPKPIAFKSCQNLQIRDITIINAPNYNISLLDCENVVIEGVTIRNGRADGIDLDNCRFARVSNCYIDAFDDGVCLKTSPALGRISSTSDITVTNCNILTSCYALKMGTESSGDCTNVTFTNCTCLPQPGKDSFLGGVAFEAVDGAHVERVAVSNITMRGARSPLFLRLGNRARGQPVPTPGSLSYITVSNLVASDATVPCIIAGIPGHPVSFVSLDNIICSFSGRRYLERAELVKSQQYDQKRGALSEGPVTLQVYEAVAGYPDVMMFGPLPAWGLYVHHAVACTFKNMQLQTSTPDPRAAVVCDTVTQLDADSVQCYWNQPPDPSLILKNLLPSIRFHDCQFALIRVMTIFGILKPNARISGAKTKSFSFFGKLLPGLETGIVVDPEVDASLITLK